MSDCLNSGVTESNSPSLYGLFMTSEHTPLFKVIITFLIKSNNQGIPYMLIKRVKVKCLLVFQYVLATVLLKRLE